MNMLKKREENIQLFNRANMWHFHFSVSQWIHALNFKQMNATKQAISSPTCCTSESIFMCLNNRMPTNEHFCIVLFNIFKKVWNCKSLCLPQVSHDFVVESVTLGHASPQVLYFTPVSTMAPVLYSHSSII